MAIETVKRRVCDMCGSGDGVMRVRISLIDGATRTATVDLCSEHQTPMRLAMEAKPVGLRKQRAVTPKKEVTARKRARKRV